MMNDTVMSTTITNSLKNILLRVLRYLLLNWDKAVNKKKFFRRQFSESMLDDLWRTIQNLWTFQQSQVQFRLICHYWPITAHGLSHIWFLFQENIPIPEPSKGFKSLVRSEHKTHMRMHPVAFIVHLPLRLTHVELRRFYFAYNKYISSKNFKPVCWVYFLPIMGKYFRMFCVRFPSIICQWKMSCGREEWKDMMANVKSTQKPQESSVI